MPDLDRIDVIAPNFKRRLSGVTSTVVRLVPLQAKSIAITACAPALPDHVPNVAWTKLLSMARRGPQGPRVWHARRNVEMIAGLVLRALGKDLRLLFTSASQRHHTGLTKALISRMDAVIATSAKTARYLDRPAQVIHHGIDTDAFRPAENRAALRAELGLQAQGPLIGCLGRIRAQKGTDVFVDAMIRVAVSHPTAQAIVLGRALKKDAAFLEGLKSKVNAAGLGQRIRFLGEVPVWETAKYYQAMDLYIAPQRWEGFGLTPLEAMACGAPVIATRVGAFEELVIEGETGHLIAPGDAGAMADKTGTLLGQTERLSDMGQAARRHMVAHFQLQHEADAINTIYRQLLAG